MRYSAIAGSWNSLNFSCRDFVAFVGAIGFTPMDFILPIILWQKVGKHSLVTSCINWTIVVFYSIIAVAGERRPISS